MQYSDLSSYASMIIDMFVTRGLIKDEHKSLYKSIMILMDEVYRRAYEQGKRDAIKENKNEI